MATVGAIMIDSKTYSGAENPKLLDQEGWTKYSQPGAPLLEEVFIRVE